MTSGHRAISLHAARNDRPPICLPTPLTIPIPVAPCCGNVPALCWRHRDAAAVRFPSPCPSAAARDPFSGVGQVLEECSAYVGLDVHKDTIAVAVARPGLEEAVNRGPVRNTDASLQRLVRQLSPNGERLSFSYEASPCGYGLYRELMALGHGLAARASTIRGRLLKVATRLSFIRRKICIAFMSVYLLQAVFAHMLATLCATPTRTNPGRSRPMVLLDALTKSAAGGICPASGHAPSPTAESFWPRLALAGGVCPTARSIPRGSSEPGPCTSRRQHNRRW